MSFWDKENLNKLKGKLGNAVDKATEMGKQVADQAQVAAGQLKDKYDEVSENPTIAANKIQLDTIRGRVDQALMNWLSVYMDEMLNGVSDKDAGGCAKGVDVLSSIKDMLTLAQARVTGVKDGEALSETIINLGKVTNVKSGLDVNALFDTYHLTSLSIAEISDLSGNKKVMDALEKGGNKETFETLVKGFNYEQRCAAVAAKCKPAKLAEIMLSEHTEKAGLALPCHAEETINELIGDVPASEKVSTGIFVMRHLQHYLAPDMYRNDYDADSADALYNLSEDIGAYNLSMSVSSNAMAYAAHYSAQLSNGAKAIAGEALGWFAKQRNKGNTPD